MLISHIYDELFAMATSVGEGETVLKKATTFAVTLINHQKSLQLDTAENISLPFATSCTDKRHLNTAIRFNCNGVK